MPKSPMNTNCPYLGLATNTRMTPIPRMMMAVLKLLAPTRPTMGRIIAITLIIVRIFPIFFISFVITWARNNITATLANSEG